MSRYLCLFFILLTSYSLKAELIAYDLTDSGNQKLLDYQNQFAEGFSSAQDAFHIIESADLLSAPEQFLDRSLQVADSLGLVDVTESNYISSFVASDTVNSDHNLSSVSATWSFDVSGYQNISLSMAVAAMGDFESNDQFGFFYAFDGQIQAPLWTSVIDTRASHDYEVADGKTVHLNDPLLINDNVISNRFSVLNLANLGSGDVLSLTFNARTDGGNEVFAFNNLQVFGDVTPQANDNGVVAVSEPAGLFFMAFMMLIFTQLVRQDWF